MPPIIPAPGPNGPWRVLILDRDPADPKWILATIATPDEIRPARPDATVDEVTAAWVASAAGLFRPTLTPLPGALAWRVDEGSKPRRSGSQVDTTRQPPGPADGQGRGAVLCGMAYAPGTDPTVTAVAVRVAGTARSHLLTL